MARAFFYSFRLFRFLSSFLLPSFLNSHSFKIYFVVFFSLLYFARRIRFEILRKSTKKKKEGTKVGPRGSRVHFFVHKNLKFMRRAYLWCWRGSDPSDMENISSIYL